MTLNIITNNPEYTLNGIKECFPTAIVKLTEKVADNIYNYEIDEVSPDGTGQKVYSLENLRELALDYLYCDEWDIRVY